MHGNYPQVSQITKLTKKGISSQTASATNAICFRLYMQAPI